MIKSTAHVSAYCELGKNVSIWHFVLIRGNPKIGNDVSIGSYTEIAHDVIIGNGTRIHSKCFIPEHTRIKDNVWLGPCVTIVNDLHPQTNGEYRKGIKIGKGAIIGANATLMADIGAYAIIGAGAVVTKKVPKGQTWIGNPARRRSGTETMQYL